jgi:hypothetical protein
MPHKLYSCCDSNNCRCGEFDHIADSEEYIPTKNKKVSEATLTELKIYVRELENEETLAEITKAEILLEKLKAKLK